MVPPKVKKAPTCLPASLEMLTGNVLSIAAPQQSLSVSGAETDGVDGLSDLT